MNEHQLGEREGEREREREREAKQIVNWGEEISRQTGRRIANEYIRTPKCNAN